MDPSFDPTRNVDDLGVWLYSALHADIAADEERAAEFERLADAEPDPARARAYRILGGVCLEAAARLRELAAE